jgi:methylase of polypeptide subunit release factors
VLGGRAPARSNDGALWTLVKLLYLGAAVSLEEAADAFAPLSLERLEALGVLEDGLPAMEIVPMGRVLVASDPERETRRADRVPGPAKGSRELAAVTPRTSIARAFDMGSGSGVQALLLAAHTGEIVASDVNPRALEFTSFNAALNGLTSIDVRHGSLFEPVAGEQFDVVVSNPPYVISPDTDLLFRDGGLPGDSFSEAVVRQTPEVLREGGLGLVAVNWVIPPNATPVVTPTNWIGGTGCDAIVLHTSTWATLDYATSWTSLLRVDPAAYGDAIDRWVAHLRAEGIERIGGGVVILRRRSGRNWALALDTGEPQGGAEAHVRRLFAAQDYLRANGDDALLDARFEPAEDHVVELALRSGSVVSAQASLTGGLGLSAPLDQAGVNLLEQLTPDRTLRDAAGEGAAPLVRPLVERGFVVPVE